MVDGVGGGFGEGERGFLGGGEGGGLHCILRGLPRTRMGEEGSRDLDC